MADSWYALHSHPRKEDALYQQLIASGIEAFYPRLLKHPVNPRARKIAPYFPGYLFIRVDLDRIPLITFQRTPHAVGLVTFGGEAAVVSDVLICGIREYLERIGYKAPDENQRLKRGDPVVILSGIFAQYPAVFDITLSGSSRVRVLIKMLNSRLLPVELDSSQIIVKR